MTSSRKQLQVSRPTSRAGTIDATLGPETFAPTTPLSLRPPYPCSFSRDLFTPFLSQLLGPRISTLSRAVK